MPLPEPHATAREAAAPVPVMERPPQRRGNRAGASIDLHDPAVPVVSHHHPAGVARQTLGRSSWNACAVLEDRLAGLIGVGEDLGVSKEIHPVAHKSTSAPRPPAPLDAGGVLRY